MFVEIDFDNPMQDEQYEAWKDEQIEKRMEENNMNEWILTDDDSSQHVKKIGEDKFELIEMSLINPETEEYVVYTDEIDVDEYLEMKRGELIEILEGYYESGDEEDVIQFVMNHIDSPSQIIAECIFEYYGAFQSYPLFTGKEKACREFIENYISKH